jgi:hypothetical protein
MPPDEALGSGGEVSDAYLRTKSYRDQYANDCQSLAIHLR